jgi:hypothetical protein
MKKRKHTIKHNLHDKHKITKTKKKSQTRYKKSLKTEKLYPKSLTSHSYNPTINNKLVSLNSNYRQTLHNCNIKEAFHLKEPLKIGIPGFVYGKTCFSYDTPEAKQYLLANLKANKHIDINTVIPPKQLLSNCWFNCMFVAFFISDKGRKFFHFLRQLMIEGTQQNGSIIPTQLKHAFALLNFGIDASLQGNKFAYEMNTNSIIHKIYTSIPDKFKGHEIIDINEAGNPLFYYLSIINYLKNKSISVMFIKEASTDWQSKVIKEYKQLKKIPHIIVFEIFDEDAIVFNKKPKSFRLHNAKFEIDSAIIRDMSKQHFSAAITAEKNEIGYDGMSFHKLTSLEWKDKLNSDYSWQFKGSLEETNGNPMIWNFRKCYQLLMYYRT